MTYDGLVDVGIEAGVCSNPIAETLLRRFFNAPKAEDCGSSINKPYRHLYRYGYLSGSRSWRRKSNALVSHDSPRKGTNDQMLTSKYRTLE